MRFPGRIALALLALSFGAAIGGSPTPAAAEVAAQPAADPPSDTVNQMVAWVIGSGDNGDRPFAIVDKVAAEVFVFEADGELRGQAPALVGLARGDDSPPGIGERPLSKITPEERTTPAGRFEARYGPEADGGQTLWVDYADAISMHPVIYVPKERRAQRLRSPTAEDNRITFGCINVPVAFYRKVVRPTFKGAGGVVYVLPEEKPLGEVFPEFALQQTAMLAAERDAGEIAAAAGR